MEIGSYHNIVGNYNTSMGAILTGLISDSISIPIWVSGLLLFGTSGIICGIFKFKDYQINKNSLKMKN